MGRSHAVRLAQEGADVILIDICESLPAVEYPWPPPTSSPKPARLVEAQGRRAVTHVVDVRDLEALTAAVDDGVAQLGGIDASVANAGGADRWHLGHHHRRAVAHRRRRQPDRRLEHLPGRHPAPDGARRQPGQRQFGGRHQGFATHTPYTASKHGVVGMSKALANELAAVNIRVNTVHPTVCRPACSRRRCTGPLLHDKRADLGPIFQNALPIVMAEAVDISNAVLFLDLR